METVSRIINISSTQIKYKKFRIFHFFAFRTFFLCFGLILFSFGLNSFVMQAWVEKKYGNWIRKSNAKKAK
jgi:hypothetical protein